MSIPFLLLLVLWFSGSFFEKFVWLVDKTQALVRPSFLTQIRELQESNFSKKLPKKIWQKQKNMQKTLSNNFCVLSFMNFPYIVNTKMG